MQLQCTTCHGSGKQDEVRDEYGNTASCPECGGAGQASPAERAVAAFDGRPLGMVEDAAQDRRYEYVRCTKCRHLWQRIDWGCAAHQLFCGYPVPAQPALAEPMDHVRIVRNADGLDELV